MWWLTFQSAGTLRKLCSRLTSNPCDDLNDNQHYGAASSP
jgi:hypothetical protein